MGVAVIQSAHDAELNAAAEMRKLGFTQVVVSPIGPDAGIDVRSREALAQVKWKDATVGRPDLQRLYGARGEDRSKTLLFFSKSPYTRHAAEYANEVGMCLFVYGSTGSISPANKHSLALAKRVAAAAKLSPVATNRVGTSDRSSGAATVAAGVHGNLPDPDAWDKLRAGEGYTSSSNHRPDDVVVATFLIRVCSVASPLMLVGAFIAIFIHDGHLGMRIVAAILLSVGAVVALLFALAGRADRDKVLRARTSPSAATKGVPRPNAVQPSASLLTLDIARPSGEVPQPRTAQPATRPPTPGNGQPSRHQSTARKRKKRRQRRR